MSLRLASVLPQRTFALRGQPWHWVVFVMVGGLVLIPAALLVLGSFSMAKLPTDLDLNNLAFTNYVVVWTDPQTFRILYNTTIYVTGSTIVGVTLAATLAYLVERTDIPGKIWIYAGVPMALAIPGLLQAMAWVILLSPKSGFLNKYLMTAFDLAEAPINIYSLGGMIFVEGLRLVPTAFLMLVPLLRSMDPALEDAAATSGARPASVVRKVTLALMAPGIIAVVIYQAIVALEVFEIPGILGMPVNIHVFSTRIYLLLAEAEFLPTYGQANALAMMYLAIAVIATYFYGRVIRSSEKYTVVTGKGYRPRLARLGGWRTPACVLVVLFLFLSIVLPFLILLYTSLVKVLQAPSAAAFQSMSFKWYSEVVNYTRFESTLANTLLMVFVTATVVSVLSFLISYIVVRSHFSGRRTLDQFAFLPHAVPGIVLGLAFLWVLLEFDRVADTKVFGSIWSLVIALTVSFLAYGTRTMNAAMLQIHKDLEEAALVSKAVPWRVMWKVFVPLVMPSLVGIWIYIVLLAVRLAGVPLVLYEGRRNEVLAVLIWYLWDDGEVEMVAAMGVMLMVFLFALVLLARVFGFGRNLAQVR